MAPVSIDTTPVIDERQPVSIDTSSSLATPLTEPVISTRSTMAHYGIYDISRTYEDIKRSIAEGKEDQLRGEVASKEDVDKADKLRKLFSDMSIRKGGPLTTKEMQGTLDEIKINKEYSDPKSIFEEKFSKRYVNTLYGVGANEPGSWWDSVVHQYPNMVAEAVDVGTSFLTKDSFLRTQIQDAQSVLDAQSWGGRAVDFGKNLLSLGIYGEVKLRGNIPGTPLTPSLGNALEEQRKALYRLPFPEFKAKVVEIADRLKVDNPSLAVEFLTSMLGMSKSDILAHNFSTAATAISVPGTGFLTRKVAEKFGVINPVKKAVADSVESAKFSYGAGVDALWSPKVAAAAGAGDIGEAAVLHATGGLMSEMRGTNNPAKWAIEALPSVMKSQSEDVGKNFGNFRELVNQIQDGYITAQNNVLNVIQNQLKVGRTPELATEDGVRAIKTFINDRHPNLSKNIVNIDAHHDVNTNAVWAEIWFGKSNAEFWDRPEHVWAFAKEKGIVLKGSEDGQRQLELQSLVKLSEDQLKAFRKEPEVYKSEIKSLEDGLGSYYKELNKLKASPGASIEQVGGKYYLSKYEPVPENAYILRDLFGKTKDSKTPDGYLNSFLGWLRTPEETASVDARANAKIATYGPANLLALAKQEMKDARKLAKWSFPGTSRKEMFKQFEEVLKFGQTATDPLTGETGYTFRHIGDIESHYLTMYHRPPTEGEILGYFAWKRYVELDGVYRDMRDVTNKLRLGTERHSIVTVDKAGKKVNSPFVDAIRQKEFPGGEDNIMFMGSEVGKERVFNPSSKPLNKKDRDALKKEVEEGKQAVYRIYDPERRPLAGFGSIGDDNSLIRFFIAPNVETKPISFSPTPRRGGGHFDYDYPLYIKQGNISFDLPSLKYWYFGDRTVMPIANGTLGRNIVKLLEEVRGHIKAGNEIEAEKAARNLPIDWKEHRSWYEPSRGPGGEVVPARLDKTEPFYLVPQNKLIVDIDKSIEKRFLDRDGKSQLKDGTRHGSDARQNQIQYTGQRDAYEIYTINDKGTRHNPLYSYDPATLVDPIPSMNRAMQRITNSSLLDDYKIYSVERWINEAKEHLDAPLSEILHAPFWHFNNTKLLSATPVDIKSRLLSNQFKIKQLMGTPSALDTALQGISQKLADVGYDKFGPSAIHLAPQWMFDRITDAPSFFRSVAYHAAIGMFALPQFMVQNMTYVTILGVAGAKMAIPGTKGAFLHQLSRINPGMIDKLDEIASKQLIPGTSRWKPGEWKEANELLRNTGFQHVGQENAMQDVRYTPKVIESAWGQFLDLGQIFFKEGEKNARYGAWYTAFREFRDANPTGRLTEANKRTIFERAELLSGNMSQASKSILQRGPMAFPTQFLAYNMRLAELFTGKRITGIERARLFNTFAAFYGSSAAGIVGFPLGDYFRKYAVDNGYLVGDNVVETMVGEGLPSAMIAMITGGGDIRKGTFLNFGQRYGSSGADIIKDALVSDKPWWRMAGGAVASTLSTALEQSDGFKTAMFSLMRDDDKAVPLKVDDLIGPLKLFSSANNAFRSIGALETGRWMSRKGQLLEKDITPGMATFMGLTGMQPQSVADTRSYTWLQQDRKNAEKYAEDVFLKNFNSYLQALKDNNTTQAQDYLKTARATLVVTGYPLEKYSSLISRAAKGNETLISRLDFSYHLRNVPTADRQRLMDTYRRKLQLQENR